VLFSFSLSSVNTSAPWIQAPPHAYIFRLYDASGESRVLLNTVTVMALATPSGSISASPNPCSITSGYVCASGISWTTQNVNSAQVTVQDTAGGGEVAFYNATSATNATAPWIQAPSHSYVFRLYNQPSHVLLSSVTVTATSPAATGSISASPNPCTITTGPFCSSGISWTTQNTAKARVTVQDSVGGGEVSFYAGVSGANVAAPWIQGPPHSYTFRLYNDTDSGLVLLSQVVVKGSGPPSGTITGSPNPCSVTSGVFCSSTVSWSTQNMASAKVTVQDVGGPEVPFAFGTAGSAQAPWIQKPPHSYLFRLYDTSDGSAIQMRTLTVTAEELRNYQITVPGTAGWVDTGITINQNEFQGFRATGLITVSPTDPGQTPDGQPGCLGTNDFPAPGTRCSELIGRHGQNGLFAVGSSACILYTGASPTRLYLAINDNTLSDNSGSWTVNITVATSFNIACPELPLGSQRSQVPQGPPVTKSSAGR
jgi:hypothetical protein